MLVITIAELCQKYDRTSMVPRGGVGGGLLHNYVPSVSLLPTPGAYVQKFIRLRGAWLNRICVTSLISWRRQWHPTPVLLPGKSHGWRSLVGCSPWGHQESDMTERLLSLFTFMHGRRKWQLTPVFLPGESQGQGSLVGCRLWGCTELDMTEVT